MYKEDTEMELPKHSYQELLEEKKKVVAHKVNLECKKEQLSILIERLSSMSTERNNLLSNEHSQNAVIKYLNDVKSYIFFIGDQLKQAMSNRDKIEKELLQAKKQIESIDNLLAKQKK